MIPVCTLQTIRVGMILDKIVLTTVHPLVKPYCRKNPFVQNGLELSKTIFCRNIIFYQNIGKS